MIEFWPTALSIGLRLAALIVLLLFCIPLQIREVQVKNGLLKLRYLLLLFGVILASTDAVTLYFLFDVLVNQTPQKGLNETLQVINALAYLGMALIGKSIYTTQYTEESKEFHERMSQEELTAQTP